MPSDCRIDRREAIDFTFDGKPLVGFAGDTLASALLANNIAVVGRSFKFHRPRGIVAAGYEEPNAYLTVNTGNGDIPLTCATTTPLVSELVAKSTNCFPCLSFDIGRVFDISRAIWPAGFYNKTFKWPSWHSYEWAIRQLAGGGRVPVGDDSARYRHENRHCDALVVGAGETGLRKAIQLAEKGKDVIVVDRDFALGGRLMWTKHDQNGGLAQDTLSEFLIRLSRLENALVLASSTVAGIYDHNVVTIHDRRYAYCRDEPVETLWKVRAREIVLATGAIEQPLVFPNNDLPGVMLASAVEQYARRYSVAPGREIIAAVNNDIAWQSVMSSSDAGLKVKAIVDTRPRVSSNARDESEKRGIRVIPGAVSICAKGRAHVDAIDVIDLHGRQSTINCDVIAVGGGFAPTVHLYSHAGGKLEYCGEKKCFVPRSIDRPVSVFGSANADFGSKLKYGSEEAITVDRAYDRQWIDLKHDVTVADLRLAVRENFRSVEHAKRFTTIGMAIDQGKTSNLNAQRILAKLTDQSPGEVGTTTYRPQFLPVTLGAIRGNRSGELYEPVRKLVGHEWHVQKGATFNEYGGWIRPAAYGEDMQMAIQAEVGAVRTAAALFDASPLGKIEVIGPDAAEFLNRIYLNNVITLKPGKVRYGLMLDENGVVFDDGVFARLSEEHFLVNTTSANIDRVFSWLDEWHQCEWPELQVVFVNVTSQWSTATVVGPNARNILYSIDGICELDDDAFPHMSVDSGLLSSGCSYRIQRVSFTGELSYELSVPSDAFVEILDRIWNAGTSLGLRMLGLEALQVLRMEKGYLHIGSDTDGTTNARDVGFARIVEKQRSDYLGARSLVRPNDMSVNRRQFVGFQPLASAHLRAGAQVVGSREESEGFVTSACYSPTLQIPIALGLLANGFEREGEIVTIYDDHSVAKARVVSPCFFDPSGERLNG